MYPNRVVYEDVCPPLLKQMPKAVPAATEPAKPDESASAEVKAAYQTALKAYRDYKGYQHSVGNSDQYNTKMIAASQLVYNYCNRLILKQQVVCTWNIINSRQYTLHLPLWPVVTANLSITDEEDNSYKHTLSDPNIIRLSCYPPAGSTLTCTYVGGYDDTPQTIMYAVGSIMLALDVHDYNKATKLKDGKLPPDRHCQPQSQWTGDSTFDQLIDSPLKVIPFAVKQMLNSYMRIVI